MLINFRVEFSLQNRNAYFGLLSILRVQNIRTFINMAEMWNSFKYWIFVLVSNPLKLLDCGVFILMSIGNAKDLYPLKESQNCNLTEGINYSKHKNKY